MALAREGSVLVSRGDLRPCPDQGHATSHCSDWGTMLSSSSGTWPGRTWPVATGEPAASLVWSWFLLAVQLCCFICSCGRNSVYQNFKVSHTIGPANTKAPPATAPPLPLHKEYQAFSILFYFKHAVLGLGGWHVRVSQQDSLQT